MDQILIIKGLYPIINLLRSQILLKLLFVERRLKKTCMSVVLFDCLKREKCTYFFCDTPLYYLPDSREFQGQDTSFNKAMNCISQLRLVINSNTDVLKAFLKQG